MRDTRAEDGVLIRGWQKIRKNGRLKFDRRVFEHEKLSGMKGKWIALTWNNFWQISCLADLGGEYLTLREIEQPSNVI